MNIDVGQRTHRIRPVVGLSDGDLMGRCLWLAKAGLQPVVSLNGVPAPRLVLNHHFQGRLPPITERPSYKRGELATARPYVRGTWQSPRHCRNLTRAEGSGSRPAKLHWCR